MNTRLNPYLPPAGLGVHTIPMPMALKTLVGSAPVGAPTDAKVLFFRLRRTNKVMLKLVVAIDSSTIGMPIHGHRLTRTYCDDSPRRQFTDSSR